MALIKLVADTNTISYMFKRNALGETYRQLIDDRPTGVTLLSIAELRAGVERDDWGPRKRAKLHRFLNRFFLVDVNTEIAEVCGGILGQCIKIGRAMTLPDAWAAATAMCFDVPLVTHDRDVEGVPGLRVVTAHERWRVCEEGIAGAESSPLWLGESRHDPEVLGSIDVEWGPRGLRSCAHGLVDDPVHHGPSASLSSVRRPMEA
jgi:tRNA(fMet)-specific endonuclease VapC